MPALREQRPALNEKSMCLQLGGGVGGVFSSFFKVKKKKKKTTKTTLRKGSSHFPETSFPGCLSQAELTPLPHSPSHKQAPLAQRKGGENRHQCETNVITLLNTYLLGACCVLWCVGGRGVVGDTKQPMSIWSDRKRLDTGPLGKDT